MHGNTRKLEKSPDGSIDKNVFDIMAGVSINIFVKTGNKKKNQFGKLYHNEIYGKRELKYEYLNENSTNTVDWTELKPNNPNYFFIPKAYELLEKYNLGFQLSIIFNQSNAGLATEFDEFTIKNSKKEAETLLANLKEKTAEEIIDNYSINHKKTKKVEKAIKDIQTNKSIITTIDYRPFDVKYTIYTGFSNGIMGRPRNGIMRHMLRANISLLTCRQQTSFDFQHTFVSTNISERCSVSLQTGEVNYIFPLYLYPETSKQQIIDKESVRTPNFNIEIVKKIAEKIGLTFINEKEEIINTFAPIDILDYIYAVLHSPTYRAKYKEFLKTDFPRVPYPKNKDVFWQLAKLGGEIRQIHLLESPKVEQYITSYPIDGNNTITTKIGKNDWEITNTEKQLGRIWINAEQYFENIPLTAWAFYIGGYQPAQKWLKDRKERTLKFDDILHYQKIIVALFETDRLMKEIDKIEIE